MHNIKVHNLAANPDVTLATIADIDNKTVLRLTSVDFPSVKKMMETAEFLKKCLDLKWENKAHIIVSKMWNHPDVIDDDLFGEIEEIVKFFD